MKKFGRLIYNIVALAGFIFAFAFALVAILGKDFQSKSIIDTATGIIHNTSNVPFWKWISASAALIISPLGAIFSVFSIIFFFREKDKWTWSHISFAFMVIVVTLSMVVYFVGN